MKLMNISLTLSYSMSVGSDVSLICSVHVRRFAFVPVGQCGLQAPEPSNDDEQPRPGYAYVPRTRLECEAS